MFHLKQAESIPNFEEYFIMAIFFTLLFQIIYTFLHGYDLYRHIQISNDIKKLIFTSALWISLIASYFFWTREHYFSRFILILGLCIIIISLIIIRGLFNSLVKIVKKTKKILILTKNKQNELINFFNKQTKVDVQVQTEWNIINNIDILVISETTEKDKYNEYIDFCLIHHIRVLVYSPYLLRNHIDLDTPGVKLHELVDTPLHGWQRIAKRSFDILFALFTILLITPITIITSLLIKLTSKGPILVKLTRICRKNETFGIYKFRSMIHNAHKLKKELQEKNERKEGPLFKIKNDPRITPLGRILRKTRIDELPQFINVLKGEMSIVGPRPHEPGEVRKYKKHQKKLLMIKPGITGMAQVSGASDLHFDEEVRLDMYYIENWSILLDIKIILKTVFVILTGKGAA